MKTRGEARVGRLSCQETVVGRGSGMDRCVEKGRSTGREGEKSGEAKRGVGGGAPSCWAGVHTG